MQGNMPGTVRQRIEIELYPYKHKHHYDQKKTPTHKRADAIHERQTT